MGRFDALDELVAKIGAAKPSEWDALRSRLLEATKGFADVKDVIEHLESAKRSISSLEARWEVDEVIEAITPPPEPEPSKEEKPDPNKPLTSADLVLVYDDPRGIRLHKSKVGERWFLTQVDPRTYQPQTFELRPEEVIQIKQQLDGSPYWILGAGA
ncbi:MAG: hypothetical protein H6737_04025 [Alphaproteobacteria bacterium]|nr:hypothetical protein [Alphaproteobacteria bacterium]